ncbi:helix-turn-helix domain-containing protein [Candidatus Nomurabacteria bacterium]|nr:helix-turn-helix domain-containing protein [Candidatus Nomurabacteria bacterium]
MKTYRHIQFEERFVIEKLLNAGSLIREIAIFLKRSPNTISQELKKNRVNGVYDAKQAQLKVNVNVVGGLNVSVSRWQWIVS